MASVQKCDGCGAIGSGFVHILAEWPTLWSKSFDLCGPCHEDVMRAFRTLRSARKNGKRTARDKLTRLLGGST